MLAPPAGGFADAARSLVPALGARAGEAERLRRLPSQSVEELVAAGLTRMLQPEAFGGGGATVDTFVDVCAALAHGLA